MSKKEDGHGGELGITHHANRQEPTETESSEDWETGGEDTVHLALGVEWGRYGELMGCLSHAKANAIATHGDVRATLGNRLIAVKPKGRKSGGGRGMYYPFSVAAQGFTLWICEHGSPVEQTPNVLVEMGSTLLMSTRGLGRAWAELVALVEEFGGTILWDKVSRLDVCADLPGMDAHELIELVLKEQAVCRARIEQFYRENSRWRGIQVGRGECLVRMYDKVYEVTQAKPDPVKQDLLERFRWNGPQSMASRVEFQLRRDAIKSLGIDTVAKYLDNRARLVAYLCESWFRLVDEVPDRENNNTQRADTHVFWIVVKNAFQDWAGVAEPMVRDGRRPLNRNPIRLVKQGFGCFLAAVSELRDGEEVLPEEFLDLGRQCIEWNLEKMGEIEFYRRYHGKALPRQVEKSANED